MKCTNVNNQGDECSCEAFERHPAGRELYSRSGQLLCGNEHCRHYESTHNGQETSMLSIVGSIRRKREMAIEEARVSESEARFEVNEGFRGASSSNGLKRGPAGLTVRRRVIHFILFFIFCYRL